MPVALYKRHKMSPECMLDQPVPLAYYSTLKKSPVPAFHPRTIRQLINLKTKEFVQNKQNKNIDVSTKEFTQFQVEFREVLFGMFDKNANIHQTDLDKEFEAFKMEEDIKGMLMREQNIIMGVDVPQDIDAAVEAMTDDQLDLAFEEITEPLTLTEQTAIGNIPRPWNPIDDVMLDMLIKEQIMRFERGEERRMPTEEEIAVIRTKAAEVVAGQAFEEKVGEEELK